MNDNPHFTLILEEKKNCWNVAYCAVRIILKNWCKQTWNINEIGAIRVHYKWAEMSCLTYQSYAIVENHEFNWLFKCNTTENPKDKHLFQSVPIEDFYLKEECYIKLQLLSR